MYNVFRLDDALWKRLVSVLEDYGVFSWVPGDYTKRYLDGGWFWSVTAETDSLGMRWMGHTDGPEGIWEFFVSLKEMCLDLYYGMKPDFRRIYDFDIYYGPRDSRKHMLMNRFGFFYGTDEYSTFSPLPGDLGAAAEIFSKYPLSPEMHDMNREDDFRTDTVIVINSHGTGRFFLDLPRDSPPWVREMCDEVWNLMEKLSSDEGRTEYGDYRCVGYRYQR